jgi:hypothetical protein
VSPPSGCSHVCNPTFACLSNCAREEVDRWYPGGYNCLRKLESGGSSWLTRRGRDTSAQIATVSSSSPRVAKARWLAAVWRCRRSNYPGYPLIAGNPDKRAGVRTWQMNLAKGTSAPSVALPLCAPKPATVRHSATVRKWPSSSREISPPPTNRQYISALRHASGVASTDCLRSPHVVSFACGYTAAIILKLVSSFSSHTGRAQ